MSIAKYSRVVLDKPGSNHDRQEGVVIGDYVPTGNYSAKGFRVRFSDGEIRNYLDRNLREVPPLPNGTKIKVVSFDEYNPIRLNQEGEVTGVYYTDTGYGYDVVFSDGKKQPIHSAYIEKITKFKPGDLVRLKAGRKSQPGFVNQWVSKDGEYTIKRSEKDNYDWDYVLDNNLSVFEDELELVTEDEPTPEPVEYFIVKKYQEVLHKLPTEEYRFGYSKPFGGGFSTRDEPASLVIYKRGDRSKESKEYGWIGTQWAVYFYPEFTSVVTVVE